MPYSSSYRDFYNDKQSFFVAAYSISQIDEEAKSRSFAFLSDNEKFLEKEFINLFSVLQKDKKNREEFILYCYYCCVMLEEYYISYDDPLKADKYRNFKATLLAMKENKKQPSIKKQSFFSYLGQSILDELRDLISTPKHLSKSKNKIALLNACRIYWIFDKLVISNSLILAEQARWIEQINRIFNKTIDIDKIIKTMEVPAEIFRALSIGFFVARFIINAMLILKHTFLPSKKEKDMTLSQRFTHELWKRHPELLNDVFWAFANTAGNYAAYFHIAAPIAGGITAVGLVFDIGLLMWRREVAEKEYLAKSAQYTQELNHYRDQINNTNDLILIKDYQARYNLTERQLVELTINWQATNSTFWFNITAALLLATGFTAAMIVTPGVFVIAGYALCLFGVAMYLSAGSYSNYKEKSLRLEHAKLNEENDLKQTNAQYIAARNDYMFTMVKNVILPTVIIATLIVCWEAALFVCTAYLVFELYRAYSNYLQKQQADKPNLIAADDIALDMSTDMEPPLVLAM